MKRILPLCSVAILLASCAALDQRPAEEKVAERAQARVDLLLEGKFEDSMRYTTPGYRSTAGLEHYKTQWAGVGMWREASVDSVDCGPSGADATLCDLNMRVTYSPVGFDDVTVNLQEQWILVNGAWYLYQQFGE